MSEQSDVSTHVVPKYTLHQFDKYLTIKDMKMLYKIMYDQRRIMVLTFMADVDTVKQMVIREGKVIQYGKHKYEELKTEVFRNLYSMVFSMKGIGVKIVFTLNDTIKIMTRERKYCNVMASCRFYNSRT